MCLGWQLDTFTMPVIGLLGILFCDQPYVGFAEFTEFNMSAGGRRGHFRSISRSRFKSDPSARFVAHFNILLMANSER